MTDTVFCAIIQDAPIPLAISDGIAQAAALAEQAAAQGARLIAFGETFLGGYPIWLDEAPGAALWDHPGTRALHALLLEWAVVSGDPRLEALQIVADTHGCLISIGAHERVRSSLYNNQLLLRPGLPPLDHRKLVPTHGERLIWARGDGATLGVHHADFGAVGTLICWEHWMPLARAAMHNLGEAVHIACWPTVRDMHLVASRHYAFEGSCHVLAAGTVLHRDHLLDGLKRVGGGAEAEALLRSLPDAPLQFGGSAIIGPDGDVLAQAGDSAQIITASVDVNRNHRARTALDSDGHYSRPDVFALTVNTSAQAGVIWRDDGAAG